MPKRNEKNVIVDKNSEYGKKPPVVITSQGTPEHKRDPIFTMSAHDKSELFIAKMRLEQIKQEQKQPRKIKSKIQKVKKKIRGVKK
jgi:hypothetical protein|tara:strand:- start:1552 stop:1809 length:258 start_codon:yes stop_codon:yes gene_type:complete